MRTSRLDGRRSARLGVLALSLACATTACLQPPPAASSTEAPTVAEVRVLRGPLDIAKVYAPGEVRQFELLQGEQSIGTSWGRYVGVDADGNHRFETRIELRIVGRPPARSEGELVLDRNGWVVRGAERSDVAELKFERVGDVLRISDGTTTDELAYDPAKVDTACMAHSAILHAELMYALREIAERPLQWRLVSLSGGLPVEWSANVTRALEGGARIELETSLGERVVLAGHRIESIEVPTTELRIVAIEDAQWPAFEIAGPRKLVWTKPASATFDVREVELPGSVGAPKLMGEVLLPPGKGPHPAVVFLSATGREDRHGFAGPPPVDLGSHEITDALAQAGFVVLRYDERGRGASEAADAGFLDQVDDARRALATIAVQPEVDPSRIVVVGHGEGGLRALVVANDPAIRVRALVLLAPPGRRYEQVLRDQAAARLLELPPEVRDAARTQQSAMIDDLVQGRAVPPELAPQAKWLREVFAVRPDELLAKLRIPVLLAQGGKDFEVDPKVDVAVLVKAGRKGRVKLDVRRYPELDHLFKVEPEESAPARYTIDRRVDTTFITDLVSWTTSVMRGT
jgi:pimeloyl-ACP methyl ester carboxylesterase